MRTKKINKKQQLKQSKGITLIALVITIIVLLILAGVSIVTLTGENGILTRADNAKIETTKAEARERIQLETSVSFDNTGKYNADTAIENLKNNAKIPAEHITKNDNTLTVKLEGYKFYVDDKGNVELFPTTVTEAITQKIVFPDNTRLKDSYGNSITVPAGFKIASDSAIDVAQGVVIEDATYEGTLGSQFVWIPVGTVTGKVKGVEKTETIILGRYDFTKNSDGTITTSAYTGAYVEENAKDTQNLLKYGNAIAEDIEAFKASTGADKNGGYYIGRYEAGLTTTSKLSTTDMSDSKTAPNEKWTGWSKQDGTQAQIVCKQGQQVWNYITQNEASELSKNMYTNDLKFTSDLINSYAWDTAIVFIQTFGVEDNSSIYSCQGGVSTDRNKPSMTGSSILSSINKVDKQCNIFDMAGNCFEWSTETSSNSDRPCVTRGGYYLYNDNFTGTRGGCSINHAHSWISFRPILYL